MSGSEGNEDPNGPKGSKGPSKIGIATTAYSTYSDLKKLMEGDPMGAVGLLGDAGKWAQLLIPEAVATPVIATGLKLLMLTSVSMGEGSPDGGDAFSAGAKQFHTHGKSLEGAYPTETWSGSASDAYTAQNSHQIQRATTMLEADNDIVRILSTQAQQVDHARTQVDWASKGLAAMIPVALALEATVLGAPESIALQVAAVAAALAVAGLAANNLHTYAGDNAAQIREVTAKYREAGSASTSSTGSPAPPSDSTGQDGPSDPGNPNGSDAPADQGAPPNTGNPGGQYGGGSGGGSGSGSGGGSGSGSGGGSSAGPGSVATGRPGSFGTGAGAGVEAKSGATPSASPMGGVPSLPQMGGGSGGSGAGFLGGLAGLATQIVEVATQAAQQTDQQDPNAQNVSDVAAGQPGEAAAEDPAAAADQSGGATGGESPAGRAPIHVSFEAGAAHAELAVDPETTQGPIHVRVDPANPTAAPRITTDG